MSSRVVLLGGAGAMGRITAQDLARTSRRGAVQVVVADREDALAGLALSDEGASRRAGREASPASAQGRRGPQISPRSGDGALRRGTLAGRGRADRIIGARGHAPDVERVVVDVTDPASLRRALAGAFAVIASLPYRFNLLAMQGALEAGCHYLDLGGLFHMTRRQLELGPEFARAKLTAVLGIGSAPGIVNVLAAHAARGLDSVREVHCLVGAVDHTRFRSVPPLGFGYSVETLLDEFAMPSAVFRKGAFAMVPALDPRERIPVRFPPPIGTLAVDTTLHSEVATLPGFFGDRGIREVTFRQGFDRGFMDKLQFLVELGLAGTEPLSLGSSNGSKASAAPMPAAAAHPPDSMSHGGRERLRMSAGPGDSRSDPSTHDGGITPRRVLLDLLGRLPAAVPAGRPDRHEVLRAVVRGRRGRKTAAYAADCYAGPRSGRGVGPDIDTGAPPSIVAQLMLEGRMDLRPGVWAPEQIVPAEPFFHQLRRRGMRLSRRVIET